jgi:hypothetical protein
LSFLKNDLFLSKAERDYLTANPEISGGYSRVIKSRLQKKIQRFAMEELPILVEKGYLDVTEFRNVTGNCNALVAQPAERGFVTGINGKNNDDNEIKSPRWDLNPRPKVSAPPFRIMERGITKPSLCQLSY